MQRSETVTFLHKFYLANLSFNFFPVRVSFASHSIDSFPALYKHRAVVVF